MLRLQRLDLTDFRNFTAARFTPAAPLAVVCGPNGAGKTNLLEALSLLAPGRGLRGARLAAVARADGGGGFALAARFSSGGAPAFDIATGLQPDGGRGTRRRFLLNGAEPPSQAEVASLLSAVWLTPQMNLVFDSSASGRRRFLDRLVVALAPSLAAEAGAHEAAMTRRNKLLAAPSADPAWLAALEDAMARHAVAVAAMRRDVVGRLNTAGSAAGFPAVEIRLMDRIADALAGQAAVAVEAWLRQELLRNRARDREAGGAAVGAHRADIVLADRASGEVAARASTGQRHAMLLGLVLAHARLIEAARGAAPMLLLDEPLVHLDETRRDAFFAEVSRPAAQIVMTGTDAPSFAAIAPHADLWSASEGGLARL